jgi:hypothetical protein
MYNLKSNDKEEELRELQEKCTNLIKSNKKLALIILKEWSKVNFLYKFPIQSKN